MIKLAQQLRALLLSNDITVAQLSRGAKIPRQTLDNWLSGQEPRSISQLKVVAQYFDVSVDYLCFEESNEEINEIQNYSDEINAGVFEVVLRRIKQ